MADPRIRHRPRRRPGRTFSPGGDLAAAERDFDTMKRVIRKMPVETRKRFAAEAYDEVVQPTVAAIKQSASTTYNPKMARKAARSVKGSKSQKPSVKGGGGAGLPGILFFGAEFGGGGLPGSAGGRRTNGRRSTKQFGPHRGTQGRFFMPGIRSMYRQLPGWMNAFADDVIAGGLP